MEKAVGQREKGEQTPLKRSPATAHRGHARVTPVSTGHFRTGFCNDAYGIQSQHADAVMWFYSSCLALHKTKFGSQELRRWPFSSVKFLKSMGLKTRI